ncbi:fatty acid--CoA ligase family protein [Geodermatophilus sp. DF01-2]|uniref:FadD3 family acyl-CoA ligase n=1 Tax=Geodermatophilus sp. DF01-2 TaxID=2559610 RepID=UPI001073D20B|nr:FadD3 family acyl-CoA ligase [Geodermatophilus sp. DF01_2]TFV64328.1 fatty acid--CoA ligase family protein [Geodermatophilus sp. DF01_2]
MGSPAADTVPVLLRRTAAARPHAEAVVIGTVRWTYADLLERVRTVAAALLHRGVRPGDRVAIWAPNSERWVAAALALQHLGVAVVPVNTRYKGDEARDLLARTGAVALLTESGFLGLDYAAMLGADGTTPVPGLPALRLLVELRDAPTPGAVGWTELTATVDDAVRAEADRMADEVTPAAISSILFTSGTTGRPKGAMLGQGQLLQVFSAYARGLGVGPDDRALAANPFFHTFGYAAGILTCLLVGATLVPLPQFDPAQVLETIERERITWLPGPPTVYAMLMDSPARPDRDTSSLRLAVTGASVVPGELIRRMRADLGFRQVLTAYGLTESSGTVTMCSLDDPDEVVEHTSGRPLPGVQVEIRDQAAGVCPPGTPGEIYVRGPNVMVGYLDDPEATAEAIDADGWLHTGDIGFLDEGGCLHITDRLKDMFIVGGFNAYPAEIERLLTQHPAVSQAAVIGVPDARLGEVGRAYVIPRLGAELSPAELIAWAQEHMANYKVPREVVITDDLPRNGAGKISKLDLREQAHQA